MLLRRRTPEHWEPSLLPTNDGLQQALLFRHPLREKEFPDVYLLAEPHPLRPLDFSPGPLSTRTEFKDYVVTVRKDLEFMESWQETGANTGTPCGDISLNLKNGMLLPPPPQFI